MLPPSYPVSVERFYNEVRNITSTAEAPGSKHKLSILVAREVGWKMGREEINKKCSWKYFSRIILNVSQICSLRNTFIPKDLEKYLSIVCSLKSVSVYIVYELCLCMWRILLVTPLTNDTWHVCWETCQNSGHVKVKSVLYCTSTANLLKFYYFRTLSLSLNGPIVVNKKQW
mgnify:CR=1 FL=1